MRILLIIPDLDGGGAQKVVLTLAGGLVERGHDVHVLLMEHVVNYDVPKGVVLHSLTPPGRRMSSGWIGKRWLAYRLRRWAAGQPPFNLMIASLPFASEIASRARLAPIWHHVHNSLASEIDQISRKSSAKAARRKRRYRAIFERQRLVTVSNGIADEMRARLGLARVQTVTIYNPFDFAELRRLAALSDPDLPTEPYIVNASRFVRQKRHDVLLDAYATSAIPHRLVLLVNDDPALRDMIRARGLETRVTIAGFRTNPYPWFANAAALVLSSDFEGFGNVLVEALACGTPAVSTCCPSGPDEILTGPLKRYLSPPGDVPALAQSIRDVIRDPPPIDAANLERFSLAHALDRIEALAP